MSNLPLAKGLRSAPASRAEAAPSPGSLRSGAACRVRRDLDVGARARRVAGRRPRARLDGYRRRLHRRSAAIPGLDPRRIQAPPRLEPVRPAAHPGRLLPARRGALRRAVRARRGALAVAAAVEAGRRRRMLLRRARVRARQPVGSVVAPGGTGPGPVLRLVHRGLRLLHGARGPVPGLPVLGLHVRAAGDRRDRRRDRASTPAPTSRAGSRSFPRCWGPSPACCTPGTANC